MSMSRTPTKRPADNAGLMLPSKLPKTTDTASDNGVHNQSVRADGNGDSMDAFRVHAFSPCSSQPVTQQASAATGKREDYLPWSEYFMAVAFLSAQRSKDPNSQVGACIVNPEKKIVGIGYNGMPNGCSDDQLPWARVADDKLDTKYPYVCHAEMNAIMNKNSADVKGCTVYVALFPCNECAKLIIQSGICEIVYMSDKYHDRPEFTASRRLLDMAGVTCTQFRPRENKLVIDFSSI